MQHQTNISTRPHGGIGRPYHGNPVPRLERAHINNNELDQARVAEMIYEDGLIPVPLQPWVDHTAVGLERWIAELSVARIRQHWEKFPHHRLGFIRGCTT